MKNVNKLGYLIAEKYEFDQIQVKLDNELNKLRQLHKERKELQSKIHETEQLIRGLGCASRLKNEGEDGNE